MGHPTSCRAVASPLEEGLLQPLPSQVDPYLPNPWSDGQHGFSVVRLEPLLDPLELKACEPPRILREGPNVVAT